MRLIKPSVDFLGAVPTSYTEALCHIEKCGRLCYKSEDRITETSAEGFVKKLIKAGHLAMVEHSNFVVRTDREVAAPHLQGHAGKYLTVVEGKKYTYVGGNLTAWAQRCSAEGSSQLGCLQPFFEAYNALFSVFGFIQAGALYSWEICPHDEIPHELHRYSAKFVCDRGVSHELVRHRPCSFAQESTRYVNYGGKDMEFIEPWWWEGEKSRYLKDLLIHQCERAESTYKDYIAYGRTPQLARAVLPNALKTEIVVTADAAEWAHIKNLRMHPSAHPDMVRLMNLMPWDSVI